MCTTLSTLNTIASVANSGAEIYNKVQNYNNDRKISKFREQTALDNAKLMQEEAKNQKQIGIEEARLKKIEGIQEANRQKAINSAGNIDANSQTSAFNLEDILNLSQSQAQEIQEKYNEQAQEYQNRANSYVENANLEKMNRKNNLFKFGMKGLGSSDEIASHWYGIWGEKMSKVQIFNIVLNILGVSNPIENSLSNDNRAILLNNYYSLARDYVLKDFDWNFASAHRKLSIINNQNELNKFKYCYDYPNDCVCARDIYNSTNYNLEKFEIGTDEKGNKIIYSDCESAILRYTKRIEHEILFTCEFSMALSYYLASLTSSVITGSLQKGEIAYEKYMQILKHAKVINAQEGASALYEETTYLDTRG